MILTGFHKMDDNDHNKSIEYIALIYKYFELHNYSISVRINQNPDVDVLIMCNARYFIQSTGGFSKVISEIVKRKGGQVMKHRQLLYTGKYRSVCNEDGTKLLN